MKQYKLVFAVDMDVENTLNSLAADGYRVIATGQDSDCLVLVMERDVPEPAQDPKRTTASFQVDHFFAVVDDEQALRRDLQDLVTMGKVVENADGSFSVAGQ